MIAKQRPYIFFVAPTGPDVGLTSVCLGLVRALDQVGVRVAYSKPIAQESGRDQEPERASVLLESIMGFQPVTPIEFEHAQAFMERRQDDQLMEEVIRVIDKSAQECEVLIIEGLTPTAQDNFIGRMNAQMVRNLNCDVILVSAQPDDVSLERLNKRIRRAASIYGGVVASRVIGCVINRIGEPAGPTKPFDLMYDSEIPKDQDAARQKNREGLATLEVFSKSHQFHCLGLLDWDPQHIAPRVLDICRHLRGKVINEGEINSRRVRKISVCARSVRNVPHILQPSTLISTPGDREDVLLAASMAVMNGIPLAGLVLTGDEAPNEQIMNLCKPAFQTGLPVISVNRNTWKVAKQLDNMDVEVPADDAQRMESVMDAVAEGIDAEWLKTRARIEHEARLSPAAFRYSLVQSARQGSKRIVLPEGEEPRTIQAAAYCQNHGIANCVLLGDPEVIHQVAQAQGFTLPEGIQIIQPDTAKAAYVAPMVELRKHKGLNEPMAFAQLDDPVVLGTMMLAMDDVDGLVSGAVNTTANTVRPAMQLIKTKPGTELISSVFFMCLPEQVLVYGDCAINPDPNAEQLADIAIQSGDSAAAFGIEPRIAMISYSTGQSGFGQDVDKVREATRIAKEKRPDLLIDGPLQYDAASDPSVASKKAPDSPVAGRATVFVFPDLNTGNTTYKAVQRSASVVSIGPMLQGLRKPVNDLSRGALVEDIIYTIALTAIQAMD